MKDPLKPKGLLPFLRYALKDYRATKGRECRVFRYEGDWDGNPFHIVYSKDFGPHDGETGRFVLSIGYKTKKNLHAIVFQRYATGYELGGHLDGPSSNKLFLIELQRAKEGGKFFADGQAKNWLGGRLWALDGGVVEHGFTRIERGQRTTLIYQRGAGYGRC